MLRHFVEIFKNNSEGANKIAEFYVTDFFPGMVRLEPEYHPIFENIAREGIIDHKYSRPGRVYPDDGMIFLENLKYNFKQGQFVATEVRSEITTS